MSRSKKPVVAVAIFLGALMVLPFVIWFISTAGDAGASTSPRESSGGASGAEVVDFDLSQLAERAETLLSGAIAEAVRKGDLPLDFLANLKKEADRAGSDMRGGKLDRAKERYLGLVQTAEDRLAAIAAADKARALKDSTYAELQRLEDLRAAFRNTYDEAVASYNQALRSLEGGQFVESVEQFELAGAILGDLEARAIQQSATLLEVAHAALGKYELTAARDAFQAVLDLDPANAAAVEGLTMVEALEGIAEAVEAVRGLEAEGKLEEALAGIEALALEHPDNPFIKKQRNSLEKRILERDFKRLIERSVAAEAAGDLATAIADLEAALELRADTAQRSRLEKLKEAQLAARMEAVLEDGFQALKAARYEAARDLYKEALALDPKSKEARTGLERASSLYLANIRYSQNVASAARYIEEGRFPLAARLFNQAMTSRPENLAPAQVKNEEAIRDTLKVQSKEVSVAVQSDGRTFVSIIGVLPPERFRSKDLKLFPDVYKVRGTRSGYREVEKELKVDATKASQSITVECTEKI
ncbi:MAG: hypothetical protein ACNA77_00360 [Opitutales bacterium]